MFKRSLIAHLFFGSVLIASGGCGDNQQSTQPPGGDTGGKTAGTGGGKADATGGSATSGGGQSSTGTGGGKATGGGSSAGGSSSSATGGTSTGTGGKATGGVSGPTGGQTSSSGGSSSTTSGGTTTSAGGTSTSAGGSSSGGNKASGGSGTSTSGGTGGSGASTGGTAQGGSSISSGGTNTGVGGAPAGGTTTSGGTATTGGTGASTGGAASGGTTSATGGTEASTGGAATGGTTGSGVQESSTCPDIAWPSSNGSKSISGTQTVSGVYDGGMAVHEGTLEDCSTGNQSSTDPILEVADGGTVRNVVMGKNVGDGIHCLGSCTIENVWFPYVCDDAISALGSGTVTIRNSGFKNARDKTIQHNGGATVNIDTVYVETAGKLYRSCGKGCDGGSRTATLSNIVAIGVDQVAGAGTDDSVTLKNICTYRTAAICTTYQPGSDTKATNGANSTNDGPSSNCKFTSADTHALLSRVTGVSFSTESVCGGPNGYKSGSTATACVSGFDKCLKMCMPGGYGFKELTCTSGKYAETTGCAMPTDSTAATNLAGSRVSGASSEVTKNASCSTEWALGIDSDNSANYCVCVRKPGYYASSTWLTWDCQSQWW